MSVDIRCLSKIDTLLAGYLFLCQNTTFATKIKSVARVAESSDLAVSTPVNTAENVATFGFCSPIFGVASPPPLKIY